MAIKIILTLAFLAVMVGVGVYSRKHSGSVEGFVLGGRNVGPWLSAFAFGTSYFSAVVFVGYAGQFGWKFGLSSTWIGIGNAIIGSLLAWLVLARRTRLMTQHVQSRTMPDFFGARYDSEGLRVAASIIAFVFLIPYTAGVYMGISKLFEMSFGIPYLYCAWSMAVLTAVYVILGGYKATAINDFIQGIIMLFGITAVIVAVLSLKGGLVEACHRLALVPAADGAPEGSGMFASLFGPNPRALFGVVVLTSLGTWGLPQMVSKFYSITDEKAIRRGTVISTLFAFVVAGGCYFLGGFGRLFDPVVKDGRIAFDSIIPAMLETLPNALIALVVLLVLSASMSTLASLVLTSSSTMTLDLIYRDKKSGEGEVAAGQMDDEVVAHIERRKVVVMRVLIVFFIVISLMIALHPPHFIAQLMGISWGALAGAFLAPFMLGLYWRGVTKAAVWASFAWGVGITFINMLLGNPISPIDCGALAMLGGFPIVYIVSLVSERLPKKHLDEIFKCYGESGDATALPEYEIAGIETIARGVCIVDGKLLICRAKGASSSYLPGGHIEFGETGRQALVREMKEETGCEITIGRFMGVVENSFQQHGKPHSEINLVYEMKLADTTGNGKNVTSRENWIEFAWQPLDTLKSANILPDVFNTLAGSKNVSFEV